MGLDNKGFAPSEGQVYEYTTAQFEMVVIKTLEYYNDGDEIRVYNKRTGKTRVYKVETKKVLTETT